MAAVDLYQERAAPLVASKLGVSCTDAREVTCCGVVPSGSGSGCFIRLPVSSVIPTESRPMVGSIGAENALPVTFVNDPIGEGGYYCMMSWYSTGNAFMLQNHAA